MTQPELQRQTLRSIDLTAEQSAVLNLEADGDYGAKFLVLSRETYPGSPERWRAWLIPCTARQANAAIKSIEKSQSKAKEKAASRLHPTPS